VFLIESSNLETDVNFLDVRTCYFLLSSWQPVTVQLLLNAKPDEVESVDSFFNVIVDEKSTLLHALNGCFYCLWNVDSSVCIVYVPVFSSGQGRE
jgi:hypothetical protein